MAFIDDLSAKLSRAGNTAVQKTQEVTELARLNAQISADEKKINTVFNQIGNLYFQKYKNNPGSGFENLISEIRSIEKDIEECRNRILQIKAQTLCPSCHVPVPVGSMFCSECGARIEPQSAAINAGQSQRCPNCHASLTPGTRFCSKCGTQVQSLPKTDNVYLEAETSWTCSECGKVNRTVSSFCSSCGQKRHESREQEVPK